MTEQEAEFPDWFSRYAVGFFETHLAHLAGKPGLRFLQIGAYTGDATLWLFDNILTGPNCTLTDVDTWTGSEEHLGGMDFRRVFSEYQRRTREHRDSGRLLRLRMTSSWYFPNPNEAPFDFIYVDGDHTAPQVLQDAIHAFSVLKPGGLLAFDDYQWHSGHGPTHDPAIDAFTSIYADHLTILTSGLQVWIQKHP